MERASGKWDDTEDKAGSPNGEAAAECRPAKPHAGTRSDDGQAAERNARCGSQAAQGERSVEMEKMVRTTKEQYDSKMNYAKTTHKVELLMASLRTGAHRGYRRIWRRWVAFCRGHYQTVWIDSREEWWGGVLTNFALSEHDVVGLRASTILVELGGIRFPHIISGRTTSQKSAPVGEFRREGSPRKKQECAP